MSFKQDVHEFRMRSSLFDLQNRCTRVEYALLRPESVHLYWSAYPSVLLLYKLEDRNNYNMSFKQDVRGFRMRFSHSGFQNRCTRVEYALSRPTSVHLFCSAYPSVLSLNNLEGERVSEDRNDQNMRFKQDVRGFWIRFSLLDPQNRCTRVEYDQYGPVSVHLFER